MQHDMFQPLKLEIWDIIVIVTFAGLMFISLNYVISLYSTLFCLAITQLIRKGAIKWKNRKK